MKSEVFPALPYLIRVRWCQRQAYSHRLAGCISRPKSITQASCATGDPSSLPGYSPLSLTHPAGQTARSLTPSCLSPALATPPVAQGRYPLCYSGHIGLFCPLYCPVFVLYCPVLSLVLSCLCYHVYVLCIVLFLPVEHF